MKGKEKPKYGTFSCLGWMLGRAWRTRKRVPLACLLLAALYTAQSLAQLLIAPGILEKVETAAPLGELLGTVGFFTLALLLLAGAIAYVDAGTMYARIDVRTCLVMDMTDKGCTTSYPNLLDPAAMTLKEKAYEATDGNYAATEHIWDTLTDLLGNLLGFFIYLLLLRDLDGRLMAVVTATAVLSFFATIRVQNWEHAHEPELTSLWKKTDYIIEKEKSVKVAKDIRIFGLGAWLDGVLAGILKQREDFCARQERVRFSGKLADALLTVARNGLAYFFLIRMALAGELSASRFLLYFTAVTGFTAWVTGILENCADMHRECLDVSRVREYLDWPEPFPFEGGAPIPDVSRGCQLTLEHVSYRYPGAQSDTIKSLDLTIRPGEKLAVVGLNGAGKTTLVKLLCGFLDPTEGRVLFNGVDVRQFNRREYYKLFSAVFQDFSELDITVAQSVAQAVDGIDREKVARCLEKAGLAEAVQKLPQGMDTHVGRKVYLDGVELSGGQTQRLMLARALYKDGPMLILDEPTAALDPLAENDIYLKYNDMTANKTSVFISHRLASTRFCDRILFLADGQIAEEGTHESLLAQGGGYADLFEIQSRYYREGRVF